MSTQIDRQVERIAMSREYVERKLSLGLGTHSCTYDEQGRCRFCPAVKRAEVQQPTALMPQGRTGELA